MPGGEIDINGHLIVQLDPFIALPIVLRVVVDFIEHDDTIHRGGAGNQQGGKNERNKGGNFHGGKNHWSQKMIPE